MAKLDILRKLIREEVKAAIQEQLAEILKEAVAVNGKVKHQVTEAPKSKKPLIPGTLNTKPTRPQPPQFLPGNPLGNLLTETAQSMTAEDIGSLNFDSSNAMGFNGNMGMYQPEPQVVGSVDEMFASARPSSNIEMVQINDVPDFTELMSNLRAKGVM